MKYPKPFILTMIVLLLVTFIPLHASAASKLTYDATIDVQSGGQIWFNYGKNGSFFLSTDWETYDEDCLVSSGKTNHFTKILNRGMIARPKDGYYFAGFYDKDGKKVDLEETKLDILRVSVKGFYFYNCYPSRDNPVYSNLTKTAYENQVKLYLKGLYGTTRYKVMDTVVLFNLPKTDGYYLGKFCKKTAPSFKSPSAITKTYGNKSFYLISKIPDSYTCTFKTSNSKVLTINKNTGYITIKGPGKAKVTCNVKETDKTKVASFTTTVTIKPAKVKSLTAKRTKKSLSVKWSGSSKNSGYEIQVSNNKNFKNIIAKKTVSGGSTKSTTVKLKSEVCNNYVRIRPYKTSGETKIYNKYTVAEIQ